MKLSVARFSCLSGAELDIRPLTVVVGPQASGKSVIAKLVHFCQSILTEQYASLDEGHDLPEFKNQIAARFREWFPIEAWGGEQFQIQFDAGPVSIKLSRGKYGGRANDKIRVSVSEFLEEAYNSARSALRPGRAGSPSDSFGNVWRIREALDSLLKAKMRLEYHQSDTFVPAGRSFFTSVGKTVMAFDDSGLMDPLTMRFGRLVAGLRDRFDGRTAGADRAGEWKRSFADLLGGDLEIKRGKGVLKTRDGRKVPLASLSSGQQELVPLLLVLQWIQRMRKDSKLLLTIEEPEAHLFPEAQAAIVRILVEILRAGHITLMLTTHSPYVLAALNNMIKAFAVGTNQHVASKSAAVAKVVPEACWLSPATVRCYSIVDGVLYPAMDDEGLIDAEYLDSVSSVIARQFNELLAIEVA